MTAEKPVKGKCWKNSASYRIDCQLCRQEGTQGTYFGETGYNCYLRGGQHLKALEARNVDSPLYSHNIEMHPDEQMVPRDWKMRVTGTYPRPLLRLCSEGVAITRALEERDQGAKVVVINSKKEFNQPGTIVQKFGKLHTPN